MSFPPKGAWDRVTPSPLSIHLSNGRNVRHDSNSHGERLGQELSDGQRGGRQCGDSSYTICKWHRIFFVNVDLDVIFIIFEAILGYTSFGARASYILGKKEKISINFHLLMTLPFPLKWSYSRSRHYETLQKYPHFSRFSHDNLKFHMACHLEWGGRHMACHLSTKISFYPFLFSSPICKISHFSLTSSLSRSFEKSITFPFFLNFILFSSNKQCSAMVWLGWFIVVISPELKWCGAQCLVYGGGFTGIKMTRWLAVWWFRVFGIWTGGEGEGRAVVVTVVASKMGETGGDKEVASLVRVFVELETDEGTREV